MDKRLAPAAPDDLATEIASLAQRYKRANGPVMRLLNRLGGGIEGQMAALPDSLRQLIERLTADALERSYGLAGKAPDLGSRGPMLAALVAGAAGGAGGLPTALAELPVTVTLLLNAIRAEALALGLDPESDRIKAECLQVFASGTLLDADDGANSAFVAARLAMTGAAMRNLVAAVAPKLAAVLGQKLAAQAVPVLGAVSGAALNAAFLGYYRQLARVRLQLLLLGDLHGAELVQEEFRLATRPPRILRA